METSDVSLCSTNLYSKIVEIFNILKYIYNVKLKKYSSLVTADAISGENFSSSILLEAKKLVHILDNTQYLKLSNPFCFHSLELGSLIDVVCCS